MNAHPAPEPRHGLQSGLPARLGAVRRFFTVGSIVLTLSLLAPLATAAGLSEDEQVIFIPSVGSQAGEGSNWSLDVKAWVLEREPRVLTLYAFRKALGMLDEEWSAAEREVFNERARWFLADNERNKIVSIRLGATLHSLPRTEANGRSDATLEVSDAEVRRLSEEANSPVLGFNTVPFRGGSLIHHGEIHLLDRQGLSVISDIDDTIKFSQVRDQRALLRNTFLRPFEATEGMAEVYRAWMTGHGAQFHYVSASPVQLYVPLAGFLRTNGFPAGSFHLKEFRWRDESFLNLFVAPEAYKPGVIEPLLKRFPGRRFVLVGDSGEKDPEIYGELARNHPRQIWRIFIRDVTGEPADNPRYETAFRGLPREQWQVFGRAGELPRSLK
jgi:hypothetical protein